MNHGNYRTLHYTEAIAEAEERDELLVTLDEVIAHSSGRGVVVVHVVAKHDFYTQDEPEAFVVQLIQPHWLYGDEGLLSPIRFVGRADEMTLDEIDSHDEDDPVWDLLPECGSFLWAIPKVAHNGQRWRRYEKPWFDYFRENA